MRNWLILSAVIFLGILQATVFSYFSFFGVSPDLLLLSVIAASLILDFRWAFVFSLFAGLFKDSFSAQAFGVNTFLFPLWSFLIQRLSRQISLENNLIRIALAFTVLLIHNISCGVILIYLGRFIPPGIFLRTIVLSALYTGIFFLPVFKAVKLFYRPSF